MSSRSTIAMVNQALVAVVIALAVTLFAINAWAWVTCAPQFGGWAPWTDRVCFGEPLPR